jgi:hypothetical protein
MVDSELKMARSWPARAEIAAGLHHCGPKTDFKTSCELRDAAIEEDVRTLQWFEVYRLNRRHAKSAESGKA